MGTTWIAGTLPGCAPSTGNGPVTGLTNEAVGMDLDLGAAEYPIGGVSLGLIGGRAADPLVGDRPYDVRFEAWVNALT